MLGVATALSVCVIGAALARSTRWLAMPAAVAAATAWVLACSPVYAPYRIFVWYAHDHRVTTLAATFRIAWVVFAFGVVVFACGLVSIRRHGRSLARSVAHGSAGWGDGVEFRTPRGLILGRDEASALIRYAGDGHLMTIAPTRSGKGVSCVIPNLLTYPGSVVVTDVKSGELYAVTARHRETLTPNIHALDPFQTIRKLRSTDAAAFNPLDLIDPADDDALDDARLLAEMLVVPDNRPSESAFWVEEARGLLTGLILYVASTASRGARTLLEVRRLLTEPPTRFAAVLGDMLACERDVHGLVARSAARLLQKAEKERSGVVSTAQSQTHFLDSPRIRPVLEDSTFQFSDLKRGSMTVYVILPSDRVVSYAAYVRLMIGCALLGCYRLRGRPKERVLFLLDEFGDLGNLAAVERAIRLAASAGATFWLLLQDLSRLRATYGESAGSFLAGTAVKQVFGTNDVATAQYVSDLLGQATVPITSRNLSTGVSHGRHGHRQQVAGLTSSVTGRKLLMADEVMRLPADDALVVIAGDPPLRLARVSYRTDREFRHTFDENPLYHALGVSHEEAPAVAGPSCRRRTMGSMLKR